MYLFAWLEYSRSLFWSDKATALPYVQVRDPLEGRKDLMLQPFQFAQLAANYIDATL